MEKLTLEDIKPSSRKYPFIDFKPDREAGNNLLFVEGLNKSIDGEKVLDNLTFTVYPGDKIALVGPDELAKTTLLQVLMGEIKPDSGEYKWGVTTSQTYFPKDNNSYFDVDLNLVDWLRQYSPDQDESFVRGFLGRMFFSGEEALKKAGVISGGEKVRCMLSRMMLSGANVLFNHMNVLLVRPPKSKRSVTLGDFMFAEPLGLECVYALLKDRYKVRILDLMAEKTNLLKECKTWSPSVVGFSTLCVDVQPVLEMAEQIKSLNPNITTVVGGTQAFLSPESYYSDHIDHIVKFTTSLNIKELFEFIKKGIEIPAIDGIHSRVNDFKSTDTIRFNDYIIPDRSSTQHYRSSYSWFGYKPCAILQTSRGCSSGCSFCLRWQLEGCIEIEEPVSSVIRQINEINEPNIMITDNNFLRNGKRLEE